MMEKYYRMVIDLYKEASSSENYQVNPDRILEVKSVLANAITTAKVMGTPTNELEMLMKDLDPINK